MPTPLPPVEYLRACFIYSADLGILIWKQSRPREHFSNDHRWHNWLANFAGRVAGSREKTGHWRVRIADQPYLVHRIIWALMTGEEPPNILDHRDRNGFNNRWVNMRAATSSQSNWNRQSKDRLLPRGVYERKPGRYRAVASHDGKHVNLGTFDTSAAAHAAYCAYNKGIRGEFFSG